MVKARRNQDIREKAKKAGVMQWQIAEKLNVSATTICIWLRSELPEEKKNIIMKAIDELMEK